jgi:predicted histidine transporter YuiF (NhaC family)
MDNGLKMVIGMSLAYVTSFAGLLLAYFTYKKHHKKKQLNDQQVVENNIQINKKDGQKND